MEQEIEVCFKAQPLVHGHIHSFIDRFLDVPERNRRFSGYSLHQSFRFRGQLIYRNYFADQAYVEGFSRSYDCRRQHQFQGFSLTDESR